MSSPSSNDSYKLRRIGVVHANDEKQSYFLQIDEPYRAGLKQLDQFSHATVLWWADRSDNDAARKTLTTKLPYAKDVEEAGVFACRSESRPNPIAVTLTAMVSVDVEKGVVVLPWIDALDGTPLLDLKPYIPAADRVRQFKVAKWMADWPEWQEEAEAYFQKHETDFGGDCDES